MPGLSCAIIDRGIDRGNESIHDSAQFVGGSEQAIRLGWKAFQVSRDQKLGSNFGQRSSCLPQEVYFGKTSLPFCDLTRYRNGRSPQLGDSVTLLARQSLSHCADFGDELHSFPPCDQVSIRAPHNSSIADCGISRAKAL
jgi:hypothetical protein